jgi:4-hydroxy-tetrahydrodipicolinate synthase
MLDAYRSGNAGEAARIHLSLLPLIRTLFATTNPIAVKWAMSELGFKAGACRLPLDTIPDDVSARLRPLLQAYREPALS